jgi:hypothetical protein
MGNCEMKWPIGLVALALPAAVFAQGKATPLFANDAPIHITIQGPVGAIARGAENSTTPRDATLTLAGTSEAYPIRLSARGITRRLKQTCTFPPLRVEFVQPPAPTSLFAKQKRLKLVTHCRSSEGYQQHLLLEYSAYRIFNLITPLSYRARLATVGYAEPGGKVSTTRWGFFIEDLDDAAKRNGTTEAKVGDRILTSQIDPAQAGRVALFEYMIGNLDWSMRAGPRGDACCHNTKLIMGAGGTLVPLPYDFDYSGLVDAPYAIPPEGFSIESVKSRVYQGYCRFNGQALAAAADFRARRPAIEAVFGQIPGMSEGTRTKALTYLRSFFEQIATDETVKAKILNKCVS